MMRPDACHIMLPGSQPFENPLRRMSLFGRRCVVGLQDRVDDRNQRSELRPLPERDERLHPNEGDVPELDALFCVVVFSAASLGELTAAGIIEPEGACLMTRA